MQDPSLIRRFQKTQGTSNRGGDDGGGSLPAFALLNTPCWKLVDSSTNETMTYPLVDHLTIRQNQNENFCATCLAQGVALAKQGKADQAKVHYQQGLDLMPQHVDLLVAMGALLANQHDFSQALQHLQQAVTLDPQHAHAADYLRQVREGAQRPTTKASKSVAARQDVLMEQSLAQKGVATTRGSGAMTEYELLPEYSSNEEEASRRKRRKRKKRKDKKKRKRRKRKRRNDDSSSESYDDDSSDDDDASSYDRRRRRKRHRRKRSKKSRRRSDDESLSSSDTVDSLKLIDKKLKHDASSSNNKDA